jgi:GAF domain-containing protein
MSESTTTGGLAALTRFFVGDRTLQQTLRSVADLTAEVVPAAGAVGITLLPEGQGRTAAFSGATVPPVDQAQYDTQDGPCLAAFDEQRIVTIDSTLESARWPAFCAVAADHDVLSVLAFPLTVADRPVGALNVYSAREHAFGALDVEVGRHFAAQAAIVLANAQAYSTAHDLSVRLGEAMDHRVVIEQAKGILMATRRCGPDAAFELLVRASQRENVKLRDLAHRVVATTSRPAPREPQRSTPH